MFCVITDKNEICTEQKKILEEQEMFYKNLYFSERNTVFSLVNDTNIMLTLSQQEDLQRDITKNEMFLALSDMKSGRAPGCDGLTTDFYKFFYKELEEELFNMYLHSLETEVLPPSARKGIISLLPKKNKDSRYIKNMRPLTLLNIDYKILAKIFALRVKKVLPSIIGEQQTGFIEGREIHSNIRKTIDIVSHISTSGKSAMVISIDFIKCFDYLEHSGIFGSMEYFKFPDRFITWSRIFFNQFSFCTQNAGYSSSFHSKLRGINQGCPYSPILFLLPAEVMAHLFKNNPRITGVKVGVSEIRQILLQFADDATVFLEFTQENLEAAIETLTTLQRNTGLEVSYEKSTIYRIGSARKSDARLYTTLPLKWSDGDIEMLGITVTNGNNQSGSGFDEIINKMSNVANILKLRQLTLMGKILIINSLMASLFVYRMSVLPMLTSQQLSQIYGIIKIFLWGDGRSKVPLGVFERTKAAGGLKLANFVDKQKALHIKWVYMLNKSQILSSYVYGYLNARLGDYIWKCNLNVSDVSSIIQEQSGFWVDVLYGWCRYHFHTPTSRDNIRNQIIWGNSHIRKQGTVLIPTTIQWQEGPVLINDLLHETVPRFLTYSEMTSRYGLVSYSWLEFCSILSAIPKKWKLMLFTDLAQNDTKVQDQIRYCKLIACKKPTQYIYQCINDNRKSTVIVQNYAKNWAKTVQNPCYLDLQNFLVLFKKLYKMTNVTKLRDFHYRLLLGKIYTNYILFKWHVVSSASCDFCNEELQTSEHLFFNCHITQRLWHKLKCLFVMDDTLSWDLESCMASTIAQNPNHVVNMLSIVLKQYVHACKCLKNTPNIRIFQQEIIKWYKIEEYNTPYERYTKHIKQWEPTQAFLETYGIVLNKE